MKNLIVTIDGPAASGKSTVARALAKKLGASFLDTGAMYRAVTFAALLAEADLTNENQLLEVMEKSDFSFTADSDTMKATLNGRDITDKLRSSRVTDNARYIAGAPRVRERLVQMQRKFAAEQKRIVTEGRDQGTVAFADADYKFFLTADASERARRRFTEMPQDGQSLDKIQSDIEARDKSDSDRDTGPLKPADDAITIDTTDLNIEQVVDKIFEYVKEKP